MRGNRDELGSAGLGLGLEFEPGRMLNVSRLTLVLNLLLDRSDVDGLLCSALQQRLISIRQRGVPVVEATTMRVLPGVDRSGLSSTLFHFEEVHRG